MAPNDTPVHFNPDERDSLRPGGRRRGLAGLVIRLSGNRLKTEAAANYFLLAFAVAVFIITLVIFWLG